MREPKELPRPCAFIQWKGTDVCMDVYCQCGEQFHIDTDFAYYVRCHHCGQTYQTGWNIEMIPVPEEEAKGRAKMDDDAEADAFMNETDPSGKYK